LVGAGPLVVPIYLEVFPSSPINTKMTNAHKSLTFKQFLEETEPLARLPVELWFRMNLKCSKEDASTYAGWFFLEMEDLPERLYNKLMEHYSRWIPYDVARDDGADQWFHNKIKSEMQQAGAYE
jgi:hypothetical protein